MKIILYTILLALLTCQSYAQTAPCPPTGTRTDPANPYDERPNYFDPNYDPNDPPPFSGEPFLNDNEFDWMINDEYSWYKDNISSATPLVTPFYSSQVFNINKMLSRDNFAPADGWELITYRMGRDYVDPNNLPTNQEGETHPTVILYNKYTGLLRVLMYVPNSYNNLDYDAAIMTLSFLENVGGDYQTAVLGHNERVTQPLDNFSKKLKAAATNTLAVGDGHWILGDFPMAYDPCTCGDYLPQYVSQLVVDVILADYASINMTGIMNADNGSLANVSARNGTVTEPSGWKPGFLVDGYGAVKDGVKHYNEANKLLNDITGMAGFQISGKSDELTKVAAEFVPLLKVIPYVGAFIGLVDYFVGGGKKTESNKITAVSFQADMKITGQITSTANIDRVLFGVPGTKTPDPGDWSTFEFPMYNEVLGVFALQNTPELEYVDYTRDNIVLSSQCVTDMSYVRQYILKDPLIYGVNPAAGLELESLDATYTLTYDQDVFQNFAKGNYFDDDPGTIITTQGTANDAHSLFPRPFEKQPVPSGISYYERLNRSGFGVESWPNSYPTTGKVVLNTTYLPASCISEQSFMIYRNSAKNTLHPTEEFNYTYCNGESNHRFREPTIHLKVRAILKRKDDPYAQKVIFIATYPVKIVASQHNAGNNTITFGETVSFSSVNRIGQTAFDMPFSLPRVIKYENQSLSLGTYEALEEIIVGNNVTIDPGTILRAPKITVDPANILDTDVTLEGIYPRPSCNALAKDFVTTDFSSFCTNSNLYKPQVPPTGPAIVSDRKIIPQFTFNIFPNPGSTYTNLSYKLEQNAPVTFIVTDVQGRKMLELNKIQLEGNYTEKINTSTWSKGVYFCTLTINGLFKVKKLVIINER